MSDHLIDISDIKPTTKLFHNEKIEVFERTLSINEVKYWPENARNILDFETLIYEKSEEKGQKVNLEDIPENEVVKYLSKQAKMKFGPLKASIKDNGVRIPLIITEDGKLLDGNRRYFSCKLLQMDFGDDWVEKQQLTEIPVYIIKNETLEQKPVLQKKILAEANFVKDLREPWTSDVKAKIIADYYDELIDDNNDPNQAFSQIKEVYSVKKSTTLEYIRAKKLADEFIAIEREPEKQFERRRIVERQFVYFWEFYNKSSKGKTKLTDKEGESAKKLLFSMIMNNRIKSSDNVRTLVLAKKSPHLWDILEGSQGLKIDAVNAMYKEEKASLVASDKLNSLIRYLEHKFENTSPSDEERVLFQELKDKVSEILEKHQ